MWDLVGYPRRPVFSQRGSYDASPFDGSSDPLNIGNLGTYGPEGKELIFCKTDLLKVNRGTGE